MANPVKKVVVSNVSPFLKIEMFLRELGRHGRVVSMRLIPLGCKSPLLRHIVVFIRQMSMILTNSKEDLTFALCFWVDEFDDTVPVTTDSLKYFGCWDEGHAIPTCGRGNGQWVGQLLLLLWLRNSTSLLSCRGTCPRLIVKKKCCVRKCQTCVCSTAGLDRLVFVDELEEVVTSCNCDELLFLYLGQDYNCTENPKLDRNHLEPHTTSKGSFT